MRRGDGGWRVVGRSEQKGWSEAAEVADGLVEGVDGSSGEGAT